MNEPMIKFKRKVGRPSKAFLTYEKVTQAIMEENKEMIERKFEEMLINGYCRISEEDFKL